MIPSKNEELFYEVLSRAGLNYLSDLHISDNAEAVSEALDRVDRGKYDMTQWNELVSYIKGEKLVFAKPDEAIDCLKNRE